MKAKRISDNWLLRFEIEEDFLESLSAWAQANGVKSGFFNGVGGAKSTSLGFYDVSQKQYHFQELDSFLEVVSINGNLTQNNGQFKIHAHAVLSDDQLRTYGGHVQKLVVGGTLEIFFTPFDVIVGRQHSDVIGLDLLDI